MRKHLSILVFVLVVIHFFGMWCYYNLPVKLPLLDEVNESCRVTVLPVYKGLEQDDQLKVLSSEEILKLKEFLQNKTFHRQKKGIRTDSDMTYRVTITWSDGTNVQLRTFGENVYGGDTLAWDSRDLLILKSLDENWHINLEKLLTE